MIGNISKSKGFKGDTGETGLQGPQGLQGIQGEKGDTPSIKFRYDKSTGDLYYSSDGILVDKEYAESKNFATKAELADKQPLDCVVNITELDGTIAADKTFDEITDAYHNGKRIFAIYQGSEILPLSDVNFPVTFSFLRHGYGVYKSALYEIAYNGEWSVYETLEPIAEEVYQKQEKVFINDNKIKIGSGGDCNAGGADGDITIEQGRIKLGYGNPFDSHTEITQRNIRVGAMSDGDFLPSIDITSESITFRDGYNRTTDEPYINASEVKIINDEKVHKLSEKANAADVAQKLSDVETALDNKADKEEWKLINEVELTEDAVVEFTTDKDGNAFNLKKFKVTILMPKLETQSQVWLSVFSNNFGNEWYWLAAYSDLIPTDAPNPALSISGEHTYQWQFETCFSRTGLGNSGTVKSFPHGNRYATILTGDATRVKIGLSSGLTTPLPAGSTIKLWGCE